jgi:hypothetical protein
LPARPDVAVIADWGDRIQVFDHVYGPWTGHYYEVVAVSHDITPDDWRWSIGLDVWSGLTASPSDVSRWDMGAWDQAKWIGSPENHGRWGVSRWGRQRWGGLP